MSRVLKRKGTYNKKLQLVKKEVEKEEKAINKIWTLEGITFIAFIATVISSYILFALSTWTQVNLIPKRNSAYSQNQIFQQGRMQTFNDVRKAWSDMRLGFTYFIYECNSGQLSTSALNKYFNQNLKLIDNFREIAGGEVLPYYYGKSIDKIFDAELQWYIQYVGTCPIKPGQDVNKLVNKLHERENSLMTLLLYKAYNPFSFDKYHDDAYYSKL